jgi:hypothetical protein
MWMSLGVRHASVGDVFYQLRGVAGGGRRRRPLPMCTTPIVCCVPSAVIVMPAFFCRNIFPPFRIKPSRHILHHSTARQISEKEQNSSVRRQPLLCLLYTWQHAAAATGTHTCTAEILHLPVCLHRLLALGTYLKINYSI